MTCTRCGGSGNADLLTLVEAERWLDTGELPEKWRERLEVFVEFYRCPNCDDVQDMNQVCRDWWAPEPSWCPFCVAEGEEPA